jgi:hypothetical protein
VVDDSTLATIGAVVVGFGIAAFAFRIQRAIQEREHGNTAVWIPWADRLLIGIVTVAVLLVLFPISLAGAVQDFGSLGGSQQPLVLDRC